MLLNRTRLSVVGVGFLTFAIGVPCWAQAPSITTNGIVPADSTVPTIQAGEWASIYGTNLASSTVNWTGNFPLSLGGTSVTINGKSAYLSLASPTQINFQAPDDTATGSVPVVVTTSNGTATSTVTLAQFGPSFLLLDNKHVAGIIVRPDGSGAQGGGTYDFLGPTGNSLGYATVAAKAGDTVELYAVGLGPTNPVVPAGKAYSGAAPTTNQVLLSINAVSETPAFAGLSGTGLYQINLTIPAGLGTGDVPLVAIVGGVLTQSGVVISLQDPAAAPPQIQSLTLSSSSVIGGGPVTGTINLSAPAPAGGAVVSVFDTNSIAASAPATVTVPAGSESTTFTITTTVVTSSQAITIFASYGGVSQQASLSVTPPSTAPSFSELVLYATFKPTGYPTETVPIVVQPNNGTTTYSAAIGIGDFILVNGVATNQGLTFSFSTLQAGFNVLSSPTLTLLISSASLTFTLSPAANEGMTGFSGTLSVTGQPGGTGSAVTVAGPITGYYITQP
jgi:uncharacterized protein (TIGR03437 family)